jgi:hypothetical protein
MRPTVNQCRYGCIMCGHGRPSASGNSAGQGPKKDGAPVPGPMQEYGQPKKCEKCPFYRIFDALTLSPITVANYCRQCKTIEVVAVQKSLRERRGQRLWVRDKSNSGAAKIGEKPTRDRCKRPDRRCQQVVVPGSGPAPRRPLERITPRLSLTERHH